MHVLPQSVHLVGTVAQDRVELGLRGGHQVRVRDPGAVEAVARLALLVLGDDDQRLPRHLRVTAVGDEGAHPADRVRAAAVAGRDQQLGVRPHERHRHGQLRPVREDAAPAPVPEHLDDREQVVPAPGVQSRAVVAQLVEDLLHLEGGGEGLDEHGRADGAVRDPEPALRGREHLVPQPRLEMRFELGQVQVGAGAALDQLARVVEEVQTRVDQRGGGADRAPVGPHPSQMLLGQVPAAGPEHDRRGLLGQAVLLAVRTGEVDLPTDRVVQVQLPVDHGIPGGAQRVLVVGEPHLRPGVQGVDGHLPVGGAGDLHAAILEARSGTGDTPGGILADRAGRGQEVEHGPARDRLPAHRAGGEQLRAPRREAVVQVGEEVEGLGGEDLLEARAERAGDLDPTARARGRGRAGMAGATLLGEGSAVVDEGHDVLLQGRWGGGGRDTGPTVLSGTAPSRWSRRARAWRRRGSGRWRPDRSSRCPPRPGDGAR